MLVTYVLLCRPCRRYGHIVNLKPRSFGPVRLIFTLVHPLAARFGNSTHFMNYECLACELYYYCNTLNSYELHYEVHYLVNLHNRLITSVYEATIR